MFKFMHKRKLLLMLIDCTIFCMAYYALSVIMTRNFDIWTTEDAFYFVKGIVFYACVFSVRLLVQVYKSLWRYAGCFAYSKLVFSNGFGGFIYFILGYIFPVLHFTIGYIILIFSVDLVCCLTCRFAYQILYVIKNKHAEKLSESGKQSLNKINVAIVGAGNVGVSLAELLIRNPKSHYNPYCFIDKDLQKVGGVVSGIKVYHENDDILKQIKKMPIQEIIIAIGDLDSQAKSDLFKRYKETDCKVKIYDYPLVESNPEKAQIRDFSIEDLLFRKSIKFDSENTKSFYRDKTILVTGGGGSIGSELCRQVAYQKPKKLIILDIYENNAYEIQQELIRKYGSELNLKVYIASVRDQKRLEDIFAKEQPEIVIHAAAHKHVPLMEDSACEAIKNNVFGTFNTANMAEKYNVERFILISTDKAVNPTNVMGASKRLCEMVIQCRKDSKTRFTAVRFGNVLGSNGSVIPLFKKQIASGGPITITDKRIIRYFMTIPEATQLVLEAGSMAKRGELFVLDMGNPVKILDLAENMIRLSGYVPYKDIGIKEIGLRPGEKLYEELLMESEELDKTQNEMIFIERDKGCTRAQMKDKLEILSLAVQKGTNDAIKEAIKKTVDTYISQKVANDKLKEVSKKQNIK